MPEIKPIVQRTISIAAACLSLLGWSSNAAAETPYPTSNEAAISGGAVMASGSEVGSMYYNPAVLGHVHRSQTEVTAEAFGARWTNAPRAAVLDDGSGSSRTRGLRSREFLVVPSSFAMGLALSPRWTLGIGVFAPVLGDTDLSADAEAEDSYVRSRRTAQRYELALALGWDASPNWKVGLSTTTVIDTLRVQERVFAESAGSVSFDRNTTTNTFGLRPKLGVQSRVSRLVELGATVETPTFVLSQERSGASGLTRATDGEVQTEFVRITTDGLDRGPLTGWRSALGVSVAEQDWRVSADVYGEIPVGRPGALAWGVRMGARGAISERFSLGGGLFTDQNIVSDSGPMAFRGDRWGASFGVEFSKPVRLARGESARTIEFRTTLAARYAYEEGTIGGLRLEDGVMGGVVDVRGPATSHLFFIHLGTTVAF